MKERLWFVAGAVSILVIVGFLMHWAYSLGRSELYGQVLAWRMQSDSTARACTR